MDIDFNLILSEVLKGLIILAIPVLLSLAGKLFNAGKTWIEAHTKNAWLLQIEQEAFQVVAAVGQSVVGPLKEASKDGKLSAEEIQKVKTIARDALKARLRDIPISFFPDLDQRLSDAVEAAVPQAKTVNPPQAPVSK